MRPQRALPLTLAPHARFATFCEDANAGLLAHLQSLGAAPGNGSVWLWGPPGTGKTHLLQAACAERETRRAIYLPLAEHGALAPDVLEGLESLALVAIDDVERVAGAASWERALFGLLDGLQAEGGAALLAAAGPPAATPFALADLASRAAAAAVYQLKPLSDAARSTALKRHAAARGIELTEPAARYLLTRLPRDMAGLCDWLERLDEASLAAQRRLTIPLIRETLAGRS